MQVVAMEKGKILGLESQEHNIVVVEISYLNL
jgi:hypothetical protein